MFKYHLILAFLCTAFSVSAQTGKKIELNPISAFDGSSSEAGLFLDATAIDLDKAGGVYIIDRAKHRLVKYNSEGIFVDEIGGYGNTSEKFDDPRDVCAFSTLDLFIADYNNSRVVRMNTRLLFISSLEATFAPPFVFEQIKSLTVSPQYDLFILEGVTNRILKFSRFSEPSEVFGGINDIYGQLLNPHQITLEGNKRLFVSDPGQQAIVVFDYFGSFIQVLQHPDLKNPTGLFWSEHKRLFVIDEETNSLFIFSENLKHVSKILLDPFLKDAVDVAVAFRKDDNSKQVYVLSPKSCYIFSLREQPAEQ
jgi:hypothetical protein